MSDLMTKLRPKLVELARLDVLRMGGVSGVETTQAEVQALLVDELALRFTQLTASLEHAQTVLGSRLSEVQAELARTREQMRASSDAASAQAGALVTWTKALVVVSAIYAAIAAGSFWVQSRSSHQAPIAVQPAVAPTT